MNSLCQRLLPVLLIAFFTAVSWAPQAHAAERFDDAPRIAVISAFEPELVLLLDKLEHPRKFSVNGVEFTTGTLQGKPAVLFRSEEHTSELQSLMRSSYAGFFLKKKKK